MTQYLAYISFGKKNLSRYSITLNIIKAFLGAICLSAFIYLAYFNITNQFLHVGFAIIGFWFLCRASKIEYFFIGFFIGIFWFYWMSLSFRFYELSWAIPLVILIIAAIYGVLFLIPSLISYSPYVRMLSLLVLSQIAPFGFNWFNFELIFYYTPFGLTPLHVASFMLFILFAQNLKGKKRLLAVLFLVLSLDFTNKKMPEPIPFNYTLVQTNIAQNLKWNQDFVYKNLKFNFQKIEDAIENSDRLIVFPETAFPIYLNRNQNVIDTLLDYSNHIAIITGALTYENDKLYNSTYFFDKGVMKRADKVVLVPFGETIPLPNFLAKKINRYIFGVENDFLHANIPTDFKIDNISIRNAICYEGSTKILHENSPHYMSVLSNNAWFYPSIEPTLQNLMLSLWATKSNTVILHVANGEGGGIIKPRESFLKHIDNFLKNLF